MATRGGARSSAVLLASFVASRKVQEFDVRVTDYHTFLVSGREWGLSVWSQNNYNRFKNFVNNVDETLGRKAVEDACHGGSYQAFATALRSSGHSEAPLRKAYAAALIDEGVPGLAPRAAQAVHDALLADPELKLGSLQDGCHARGVLIVEAMERMGVSQGDIGKLYAFHRDHAAGGGWQATTRDGQSHCWGEHVAATVLDRTGQPIGFDPALADLWLDVSGWTSRLGAPDFQPANTTVTQAQGMLARMNSANVDTLLTGLEKVNTPVYHYLISNPAARHQLQQLGATLPEAPGLGWQHLQGQQPQDSHIFLQKLGKLFQTGAIIQVVFGVGPFTDTPFDTASPYGTGAFEARRYLGTL